jgi:hypothetical protein
VFGGQIGGAQRRDRRDVRGRNCRRVRSREIGPGGDSLLVPDASDLLAKSGGHPESADDLIDLLALVPIPKEPKALEAWRALMATLGKGPNLPLGKRLNDRRLAAAKDRTSPPPAMRKITMCGDSSGATQTSTR